jgi:catechol 2,3-dioxygenase-like lactoylglutathione lyase family enzyme
MEINGVAHVILTASDWEASRAFYRKLLPFLGMTIVSDSDQFFYGVGGRTALGVHPPAPEHAGEPFVQRRVGLHHLCWRARSREDVEALHAFLLDIGAKVVHGPQDDNFAPGYYSVLFEDPDGVRLEMNHIPGAGLLAPGAQRLGGASTSS